MVRILIFANFALIIANSYLMLDPGRQILSEMGKLPTAWGAFFGAALGLCGVAWTTKKGFENLINAQNHRAQIELAAREHQHSLNETAEEKKTSRSSKVLASALMAELIELMSSIHDVGFRTRIIRNMLDKMGRDASGVSLDVVLPVWNIPIWDESIKSIGLLGPSLASDVATVFSKAANSREKNTISAPDQRTALVIYDGIIETCDDWAKDILHVNSRLSALVIGGQDPGPLYQSPHRVAKRDADRAKRAKVKSAS